MEEEVEKKWNMNKKQDAEEENKTEFDLLQSHVILH